MEFVRANCQKAYKQLSIKMLQATGQKSRTNSICPCYFFNSNINKFPLSHRRFTRTVCPIISKKA